MAFTRDDLSSYETKPQVDISGFDPFNPSAQPEAKEPVTTPQVNAEAEVDAAIAASVAEPTEEGINDGSTTETQAESVAATDATPEGAKDPDANEDVGDGKPRSRAQERIEELVAERNALRRYGEYLLAQVEASRKGAPAGEQPASQPAVNETKQDDDPAPTLERAEFDPVKLSKMQNEWIQKQVAKQVQNALKEVEVRQSVQATHKAFAEKTAEFRKTAPDFDLVVSNPSLPSLAPEAARALVEADSGPAIVYHLAKNPDLAVRISKLSPVSQAAAIGRIEEQLSRAKTETTSTSKEPSKQTAPAKKPAVTQAPPPPKPVQASAPHKKDASIMSMDEWVSNERARKIQEKKTRQEMRRAMR